MSEVRLYAFYNWQVGKRGEPFRMCDSCMNKQPTPPNCAIHKLADKAIGGCQADWHEDPQ